MHRPRLGRIPALPALAGGMVATLAALEVRRRLDRRAARRDALWGRLFTPLDGRPMRVESRDGTGIHVEVFGPEAAPTLVLAHGWTCSLDFWKLQTRELSQRFRVVAYDQRGHGRSDRPGRRAYTVEAIADDFQAVVEGCVPAGERFVAAGHSMGGMTIAGWAGRHPQEVGRRLAGAVLVSTGMGDLLTQFGLRRPFAGSAVEKRLTEYLFRVPLGLPPVPNPVTLRALSALTLGRRASPAVAAFTEQMILRCPAPVRAGFGAQFSSLDLYLSVPDLTAPTAVVVGEHDVLTPPWHARKLCDTLPDCVELVELPGVGHMAPLEAPEEVTRRIAVMAENCLASPGLERAAAAAGR